jgi:hypothetical protein
MLQGWSLLWNVCMVFDLIWFDLIGWYMISIDEKRESCTAKLIRLAQQLRRAGGRGLGDKHSPK